MAIRSIFQIITHNSRVYSKFQIFVETYTSTCCILKSYKVNWMKWRKQNQLPKRLSSLTWNNVNPHIRSRDISIASSCRRYGCLAATVVEKLKISVSKMTIRHAVDQIVEAWLWQSNPCCQIECLVGDVAGRCWIGEWKNDNKWKPKNDEREETVKVAAYKWKVCLVAHAWLEAGLAHKLLRVNYDSNVYEEGDQKRNEN